MEKVKLTPEQAEALEKERESWTDDTILQQHVERWHLQKRDHVLDSLHFTTLAKALYVGYEIEETYKIGDWLHVVTPNFEFVAKVIGEYDEYTVFDNGKRLSSFEFRKATPEEIAAVKKRRKWAAIGREVDEYRKGDIVMYKRYGHVDVVAFVDSQGIYLNQAPRYHSADEIELVCPVEQRFDLEDDAE